MALSENADAVNLRRATSQQEPHEEILQWLASLPLLDYERQRKDVAKSLGYRASIMDKLVGALRPKADTGTKGAMQGSTVDFADVEPWAESVNGNEVLNEVAEAFSRYVALPDGAADALALWCAHTHVHDIFDCSPRLNISSPDKQCGKTMCRDVVAQFVPRPLLAEMKRTKLRLRTGHSWLESRRKAVGAKHR